MTPAGRNGFTRAMRGMLLLALTAGIMVSVSAAQDAALAMSVETITPPDISLGRLGEVVPFAREQEAALKAQERATLGAIERMAKPRVAVVVTLAALAMLVFLTAMQIRWSVEQPHVRLAHRLGVLGILAALARTADGAQSLIIARHAAEASGKVLLEAQIPDAEATVAFTSTLVTVASVGWTVVVVAMFLALSSYFRNPAVQAGFDKTEEDD